MSGQLAGIPGGVPGAIGVGAVLLCLFGFGWYYNFKVGELKADKPHYPSSVLVVLGVVVTTIGVAFIDLLTDWPAILINALAFTFAGFFMIKGNLERSTEEGKRKSRRDRRQARRLVHQARRMAEVADGNQASPRTPEVE